MNINVFSLSMSVLFSVVFILAVHLLRRRTFFLRACGIPTVLFLCGLCVCRMVFTVELPFTLPVRSEVLLSQVYAAVKTETEWLPGLQVSVLQALGYLWLAGTGLTCAIFLFRYLRNLRGLNGCSENASPAAERLLKAIQEESGSRLRVAVCVCPGVDIPIGAGIFRRKIYLPDEDFSEGELYCILRHEYAHFCGRDLLVKMLICLFCCVYWWNPMVYMLKRDIDQILEIRADRKATQGMSKADKLGYLNTILQLVKGETGTSKRSVSPAAPLFKRGGDQTLVERFELISKPIGRTRLFHQVVAFGISWLVFFASYLVVFQPYYEAPVDEIYTDNSVYTMDSSDFYILKHSDNTYAIVFPSGDSFSIDADLAQQHIKSGVEIREE